MKQLGAKTTKINYHLKQIAEKAGIKKRLTSHIAWYIQLCGGFAGEVDEWRALTFNSLY